MIAPQCQGSERIDREGLLKINGLWWGHDPNPAATHSHAPSVRHTGPFCGRGPRSLERAARGDRARRRDSACWDEGVESVRVEAACWVEERGERKGME